MHGRAVVTVGCAVTKAKLTRTDRGRRDRKIASFNTVLEGAGGCAMPCPSSVQHNVHASRRPELPNALWHTTARASACLYPVSISQLSGMTSYGVCAARVQTSSPRMMDKTLVTLAAHAEPIEAREREHRTTGVVATEKACSAVRSRSEPSAERLGLDNDLGLDRDQTGIGPLRRSTAGHMLCGGP